VASKRISALIITFTYPDVSFYSASNTLFFSGKDSTSKTVVCSTDVNVLATAQCVNYSGLKEAKGILPLSSSDLLVIADEPTTPFPITIARVSFGSSPTIVWRKMMPCPTS